LHVFAEKLDHFKRWNMVIIKGKPLHTAIKMRWIIMLFNAEVIDLQKHYPINEHHT
jgi:hypothetical protein